MDSRDNGQDKTDRQEEKRIAERMLLQQMTMPFYESEPPIRFFPVEDKPKD